MPEGYGWDSHADRWKLNLEAQNAVMGAERSSLYSLFDARGIYENQRKSSDRKRVVNLTRSSFAGQQRYATISWNGDIELHGYGLSLLDGRCGHILHIDWYAMVLERRIPRGLQGSCLS